MAAVIPPRELMAFMAVLLRLEEAVPLAPDVRNRLQAPQRSGFIRGESTEDMFRRLMPQTARYQARERNHPLYGDTDNAIGFLANDLNGYLDDWFRYASPPPPHPAKRIAVILRRAKLTDLLTRFIATYENHFDDRISRSAAPMPPPFEVTITKAAPPALGETQWTFLFDIACTSCGSFGVELTADIPDGTIIRCPDCDATMGSMGQIQAVCQRLMRFHMAAQSNS